MEQKANLWSSIINSIANIVLSLTALVIIGGLIYRQQYGFASIIIILGIFAYLFLRFLDEYNQTQQVLTSMIIQMQNQLIYYSDVKNGVKPEIAHNINNVPPFPPPGQPEEMLMDLPVGEITVRRARE
jgi:hypothetical protein